MRKLLVVGSVLALGGCLGPFGGCSRIKGGQEAQVEESEVEMDEGSYRLTDEDVEKLIRDFPEISQDLKKLGYAIDRAPTSLGKGLAQYAGAKALLAKLRAKGWNPPEKFFVVLGQTLVAFQMANMKKVLEEMGGKVEEPQSEEDETLTHNVEVVERHMDELKALAEKFGQ